MAPGARGYTRRPEDDGVTDLRAGVATVELPLRLGTAMMGYGARKGGADALHDPLHARALYVAGASDLLIVSCEVCLIAPAQADALRERIHAKTGVPPERTLVSCIHTHSGPDTGLGELLAGRPEPDHVAPLFDAIERAAAEAVGSAGPARLGAGHAEARIGRNRRIEDGPLDTDVLVVRVDRATGAGPAGASDPLAVLYVHGCHPTALGHDNLAWSADWPWAAGEAIREALPGVTPIFVLGAHADVDPRTRGLLDLAIANQSVGVSFEETAALGREIGLAVAACARGIRTEADAQVGAASARVPVPTLRPVEGGREAALEALGLPADHAARTSELFALEHERTRCLPDAERRARIAKVRGYLRDRTARRFAASETPEVEVQVLHLAGARLLALPAEPTVAVGLDWKARVGGDAAVLGIGNGWLRYLPHATDFEDPRAHEKYEILQSVLVPEAAERLLARAEALDAALTRELAA